MKILPLNEDYLIEDIESMKKYYPNISDEDIYTYIALDPTYKQGSKNAGTYGKWILNLANKNNGKLDNIGHITDILNRFNDTKKVLKEKDIMRFKSIEELDNYLNDEENYTELTDRQKLRQTQNAVRGTDLSKDAEKVYEDSNWEVWVPHTYEASCKLGRNTSWCTATTESDYYNRYSKEGPLYIVINKKMPEKKYQFHFETGQFMDRRDRSLNLQTFFNSKDRSGLLKFFEESEGKDLYYSKERLSNFIYDGTPIPENIRPHLIHITISDTIDKIESETFSELRSLTSITIPNSVTSIGSYAFYNCRNLTSVTIPDSVTSIGYCAFDACKSLTSITIPDSVEYIGESAFKDCINLKTIINYSNLDIQPGFSRDGKVAYYADKVINKGKSKKESLKTIKVMPLSEDVDLDEDLYAVKLPTKMGNRTVVYNSNDQHKYSTWNSIVQDIQRLPGRSHFSNWNGERINPTCKEYIISAIDNVGMDAITALQPEKTTRDKISSSQLITPNTRNDRDKARKYFKQGVLAKSIVHHVNRDETDNSVGNIEIIDYSNFPLADDIKNKALANSIHLLMDSVDWTRTSNITLDVPLIEYRLETIEDKVEPVEDSTRIITVSISER